jgi:ABC-type branched-subunit amino acid transport system permease subunit
VAVGIILLSLVLLVGAAGEVSLATMALAGIGGTVLFHHVGRDAADRAGPMAYLVAMVVCALVGAAMALPALRLRGLYLALATAAFSLGVEQLVFKEFAESRRIYPATLVVLVGLGALITWSVARSRGPRAAAASLAVSGAVVALAATNGWLQRTRWSPIFPNGNLTVPRPRLLGIDFAPQANFLLLLSTVFVAVGLLLVGLRRSAYGRRLTALKNSPAACATLGMDVVRLKLSVFMLSAAVAGLGGCLYAQQLGSVTADRFSLFESMSLLMLLVVAGAGFVSGGLTAGLLYALVFVVLQDVLVSVGDHQEAFAGPLRWLAQFTTVLPALIGIGLARNPSGFLSDVFADHRPLFRSVRPVLAAWVAAEVALWALAVRGSIGNWTFAFGTIALAWAAPRVAALLRPEAYGRPPRSSPRVGDGVPLELVGIARPFREEDRREMERVLDLGERSW